LRNVLGESYTKKVMVLTFLLKIYLNHGPQEPEIYIANIPGVSNMII
jgi:hypothetical protein